jgi:hypothetical protein
LIFEFKKVILDEKASNGTWCRLPYPNHPKGCPNYGKRESCPPFALPFNKLVQPPYFLVIEEFDIVAHAEEMKRRHPNWTERQCRNLLYWQKGVVKRLKEKSYGFAESLGEEYVVLEVPEANGVDLFETCKRIGINLELYPQETIRKIMIVGKRV